jgi:carbon dioxide concentrating mechanism protein CcmN
MPTKLRSIARESIPIHLVGDVLIDPSATIAMGVLLQAEADHRITIGAGVCIGTGTIIHATGGNLDICAGVCIGRSVLIMGSGAINRNACIGAGTTAIDPLIPEEAVIPAHSLLGDRSRSSQVSPVDTSPIPPKASVSETLSDSPTDLWDQNDIWNQPATSLDVPAPIAEAPVSSAGSVVPGQTNSDDAAISRSPRSTSTVAGRANFDRLKRQLFPNG